MTTKGKLLQLLVSLVFLYCYLGITAGVFAETRGGVEMTITISSTAFPDGGMIPSVYTCDGDNISPPLTWTGVPQDAKSLAIIFDDPDAPAGTWIHWVIYNLPATLHELPQDIPPTKSLDNGAKHGITSFRKFGYGGPCPPNGTHRYYFKLYALDITLAQEPGLSKSELLEAMDGHILAEGQLMGRYRR